MSAPVARAPVLRTVLWIGLTMFLSLMNLVFSTPGHTDVGFYLFLSFLGVITVPFVLIWRGRLPEIVMAITLVACTLLTIGSSTAWVALGSMYRRRSAPFVKDPWLWLATAATTGVTYLAVARDMSVPDSSGSLVGLLLNEPAGAGWRDSLPWYTEAFVTAILMSMVLGIAAITRAQGRLNRVSRQAQHTRETNLTLSHELARYEERERIARELHDSLGSKLAAVSMLSGALRAQSSNGAAVQSHAEQLQLAAQEATAEMHEIVRTYRSQDAPATSLRDLEDLIADSLRSGLVVHSDLRLDTRTAAPSAVDRAVYRVVQEITTNAIKHAPDQMLSLRIIGGPEQGGIEVLGSNPIPAATGPGVLAPTGGSGLIGAAERVEQLGGWLRTSTANNTFAIQVWVPWRVSPRP